MRWNSRSEATRSVSILLRSAVFFFGINLLLTGQIPPPSPTPEQTPASPAPSAAPQNVAPAPSPPALVLIDAAHGGSDSGATLNPAVLEKDVNLAFARRLRQELSSRGLRSQLLRDSDLTLTDDQRAAIANSAHPALYLTIHATSQGTGLRIFSAMLPDAGDDHGPFLDWQTAQHGSLPRSRWAQQQLAATIQRTGFPFRSLMAALRPLNNVRVPALAVEIAPTIGDIMQLSSADYQQMVSALLASSLAPLRTAMEAQQ
jgi:N-acetylmuramoyl-L-alanine amidase